MFNKSEVMTKAWEQYRAIHAKYAKWQIDRRIIDGTFSAALKTAWRIIKESTALAARQAAELANPKARAIREAIDSLKFMPFGVNIARERVVLAAELTRVMGRAA